MTSPRILLDYNPGSELGSLGVGRVGRVGRVYKYVNVRTRLLLSDVVSR